MVRKLSSGSPLAQETSRKESAMQVGFIGLGQMGAGMARNLLKAGHAVTVYNRTPAKADALVAEGAARAATVADACRGEAVVTMLANDQAAEEVVFGPHGLLATLPRGALHVSASTIGVELSERLAAAHAAAGQLYVSAPVFGRPDVAAAGHLFVVAAGAASAIAAAGPLLDAVGQRTFTVSDIPARANLVKLSGNFLIACVIESLGEALALVGKAGIDKTQYLDLLTSTLFGAPVYKNYGRLLAEPGDAPVGFAAPLGLKDIKLALSAAEALGVPLPLASLLRDRFVTLLATGGADQDWSAIGRLAARDSGQS
ncbi:NAD(P)-dependent oxidoreductase [Xanthobacter agilis]|uniref:NAD(P)-dependent oxidoreductase n=1 Tax=Xanthobacter agilis TaxID=47492 RepID=UPI00372981F6